MFSRLYVGGVFVYLLLVPIFALAPYPLVAGSILLLTGIADACFSIMQATLVYLAAPPEMRSRVYGVLSVCIGVGRSALSRSVACGLGRRLLGCRGDRDRGPFDNAVDLAVVASAHRLRLKPRALARQASAGGAEIVAAGNRAMLSSRIEHSGRRHPPRRQREKKMAAIDLDLARPETRGADYIERARALKPLLEGAADEIEEHRQLPPRVVEALIDGGFFKLLIPRSLGGANSIH